MTLRLSNCAELRLLEGKEAAVQYNGRHYARKEAVPIAILGDRYRLGDPARLAGSISVFTAATFVAACMFEDFGVTDQWPPLAVEFVFPETHLNGSNPCPKPAQPQQIERP